jgi:hypothetical protein
MSFLVQTAIGAISNALISSANAPRAQYDLAFQISPVILQGGIAGVQGNLLPITFLTDPEPPTNLDEAFAHYLPLPGSTLISQAVATYPFANQSVAANATIQQPLTISLMMIAPVNQRGGYLTKLSAFSNMQKQLALHNSRGGTYIVATPAYIYNYMLLTAMTDVTPEVSAEDGKQCQLQWQLDFIQPILTQEGAQNALNGLMRTITNGNQITQPIGWSGNPSSSPANLPGVTGALGNITAAVSAFGGTL